MVQFECCCKRDGTFVVRISKYERDRQTKQIAFYQWDGCIPIFVLWGYVLEDKCSENIAQILRKTTRSLTTMLFIDLSSSRDISDEWK